MTYKPYDLLYKTILSLEDDGFVIVTSGYFTGEQLNKFVAKGYFIK